MKILDVGAGPLTLLGKKWRDVEVQLTAVDALARDYDALLSEFNITPLVRTQECETEKLTRKFGKSRFDIVLAQNTLDHSYDPLRAIKEMCAVARPGGYVILAHAPDEAEREHYAGFHQWNFRVEADELMVWNKHERLSVTREIAQLTEQVALQVSPTWIAATFRKRP